MDRDAVAAELSAALEREPEVVAAWLFGSWARNAATASSDVDVAILATSPRASASDLAFRRIELADALAARVERHVDLVDIAQAPADLVHRVLRDGVLLIDRDRSVRLRFEVDARNRYFDMQPVWREYRRSTARTS